LLKRGIGDAMIEYSDEGDVRRTLNIYPVYRTRVIKTLRWAVVLNT
jgi:hypothetical protein